LEEGEGYSERRACVLVGLSRSSCRYRPREEAGEEKVLRGRIRELAHEHPRYGCPRITVMLHREGRQVNEKRVHRLWKEEGLQIHRKPRRRRRGLTSETVNKAGHKNHVWSYDFVEDRTETGNKVRFLTVVDEYTRECLAIEAGKSMGGKEVIDCLEWLFLVHGAPRHIRSDNGPEFVAKAVRHWLGQEGCQTIYIEPGSPWENPYIESFNGKFRDECLNMELFRNVDEAQTVVNAWREEYNERRPHSSLGNLTPKEFAKLFCGATAMPSASPSLDEAQQGHCPLIKTGT